MIIALIIISKEFTFGQNAGFNKLNDSIQLDKSQLKVEKVPAQTIEQFRKNKDFIYEQLPFGTV